MATRSSWNFWSSGPCDCLGEQFSVDRIFESSWAVSELNVNDLGFPFISSPSEGFSALWMRGGDERSDVGSCAITPVDLVVQVEVGEAGGDRVVFRDDFHGNIDVVFVAELIGDVTSFVLRFWIGAANDAFEFGP